MSAANTNLRAGQIPGHRVRQAALAASALLALTVGACVPPVHGPGTAPPPPTVAGTPPEAVRQPAADPVTGIVGTVADLRLDPADAGRALRSFAESCPRLLARDDASGLTINADWAPACAAAPGWPATDAARFFATYLAPVRVGSGEAFVTGYYEPEIRGARSPLPGYTVPVYALPPDLVRAWGADVPVEQRSGRPSLGRYDGDGRFVPYFERAEIAAGALAGRGLEIAWAADPVEFFFLQIQGSGRLVAPDGSVMRIGYAGQNGREYASVGALMREAGLIGDGPGQYPASMQGIMAYLRDWPAEGAALMDRNRSWVFFRELTGDGPIGALGVPVRPHASVAADPAYTPLGAPVFLALDRPEANGLWIAQDTGGAIKGANRFDTFWGAGERAREVAGGMSGRGQALVLLPKDAAARLPGR